MNTNQQINPTPLRSPDKVMRIKRLGSLHQCRLSFMRVLTRKMASEKWKFQRREFEIDNQGIGHAVYTLSSPERSYSLVAFAHDISDDQRSDRVIAEQWDATFTLFDGIPSPSDISRLSNNVPLQEAGRVSESELTLSRANRSVRLWQYVIDCLASGIQPEGSELKKVGYLMRTTAVYGSGKFGAADREKINQRQEFKSPFLAEMITVFLIRTFVKDLVHHMAEIKGGDSAVKLDPKLARSLGIGNSTGLGMAPFILNHMQLFNNWIVSRERAISRVCDIVVPQAKSIDVFCEMLERSYLSLKNWHSTSQIQIKKIDCLRTDFIKIKKYIDNGGLIEPYPWHNLMLWAEHNLSEEGQELIASLIIEPYGEIVDELAIEMSDNQESEFFIDGAMSLGDLITVIHEHYSWALEFDWNDKSSIARVWYVSAEKLEPRLGERFEEEIEDYELPLAPAREVYNAYNALIDYDTTQTVAAFLLQNPQHRNAIRRIQLSKTAPYGEIRDNTVCSDLLPIDMLRAKLSFFGATHFDPRSDRWVRICMYSGAPYPDELLDVDAEVDADTWVYPKLMQ